MSGCCQNGTCSKCQELIKALTETKSQYVCGECLRFEIFDINMTRGYCRKPNGSLQTNEFGKLRIFGEKSTACLNFHKGKN